jgi:ACS family sodium-dependent inorganic phosphate cotransporter
MLSRCLQAYILANTSVSGKSTRSIPWRVLLSRKEVWAIIVCHFCHNWGTFILLTWMPTYYNQVRLIGNITGFAQSPSLA